MARKLFFFALFSVVLLSFFPACAQPSSGRHIVVITGDAPDSFEKSRYGPGDYERFINFGGRRRRYLVHVPVGYKKTSSAPLVLVFHGGGGSAGNMPFTTRMNEKSESEGFIAVYPDGTGLNKRKHHSFNVGPGYGYAWQHKINDVGFVKSLLDDVAKLFNIDAKRVYSTGYSNGAMMSYRLASEMPERIAAIAPIGGALSPGWLAFKKPVSVIHFHGLKDNFFPFEGNKGRSILPKSTWSTFAPVEETLAWYIKNNGCPKSPSREHRKGNAVCKVYGPCKGGSEVVLWTILDGGHTWPGGRGGGNLGKVSTDISANDLMWEFFKKHPLK